jgi:hypothetical protein
VVGVRLGYKPYQSSRAAHKKYLRSFTRHRRKNSHEWGLEQVLSMRSWRNCPASENKGETHPRNLWALAIMQVVSRQLPCEASG